MKSFNLRLSISLREAKTKESAGVITDYLTIHFRLPKDEKTLLSFLQKRNYSGNLFKDGSRRRPIENVGITAICLDYDSGLSFDAACECFQDFNCVIHTSTSHTDKEPHIRVVLPLKKTFTGDAYALYKYFKLTHLDSDFTVLEPHRHLYPYLKQSAPKDGKFLFHINYGNYIAIPQNLPETQRSTDENQDFTVIKNDTVDEDRAIYCEMLHWNLKKGELCGRNVAAHVLMSKARQTGISKETAIRLLQRWNSYNEPPLSKRELFTVIESASTGKICDYGCSNEFYCHAFNNVHKTNKD